MRVRSGDTLIIKGHRVGDADKKAEILEVRTSDGQSRYLVRWSDGRESWIYPGSDAVIEPKKPLQRA